MRHAGTVNRNSCLRVFAISLSEAANWLSPAWSASLWAAALGYADSGRDQFRVGAGSKFGQAGAAQQARRDAGGAEKTAGMAFG